MKVLDWIVERWPVWEIFMFRLTCESDKVWRLQWMKLLKCKCAWAIDKRVRDKVFMKVWKLDPGQKNRPVTLKPVTQNTQTCWTQHHGNQISACTIFFHIWYIFPSRMNVCMLKCSSWSVKEQNHCSKMRFEQSSCVKC